MSTLATFIRQWNNLQLVKIWNPPVVSSTEQLKRKSSLTKKEPNSIRNNSKFKNHTENLHMTKFGSLSTKLIKCTRLITIFWYQYNLQTRSLLEFFFLFCFLLPHVNIAYTLANFWSNCSNFYGEWDMLCIYFGHQGLYSGCYIYMANCDNKMC